MAIQSFICDRCAAPFVDGRSVLRAVAGPLCRHLGDVDVCPSCQTALLRFLAAGRPDVDEADSPAGAPRRATG